MLQHLNQAIANPNREIHRITVPPWDLHNHRNQSHKHNNVTNPFESHSIARLLQLLDETHVEDQRRRESSAWYHAPEEGDELSTFWLES